MKHYHLLTVVVSIALVVLACITVVGSAPSLAATNQSQQVMQQDPTSALKIALGEADRIARVSVARSVSTWNDEHTAIHSANTLDVRYTLLGSPTAALTVDTAGGYLPAEDLYMISPDLPTLSAGEEAILFLADSSGGTAIAGGQDGKYLVRAGQVVYAGGLYEEPLAAFYARLQALDASIALPADWAEQEAVLAQEPVVDGMDFVYKNIKWPTNLVGYKVHLNSQWIDTQAGSADEFLAAIRNAAQTWSMVDTADFTLAYVGETESESVANNRSNDIFFDDRGLVDSSGKTQPLAVASVFFSNGLIIDSDIWINDAYDWDATGDPAWREIDLESVVLHEMGHWLALGHDPDTSAVMYYSIMSGTLKRALFDNDRRGIEYIYPCTAGSGPCNPTPPPTATSTATPTPTMTPTPTPTPTPYVTPTPIAQKITRDGGVLDYAPSEDGEINLVVPPNAVVTDTLLSIQAIDALWEPPAHHRPLIDYFRMTVELEGAEQEAYAFAVPITMTVTYGAEPAGAAAAQTVALYEMNIAEARWEEPDCGPIQHDATQQEVIVPVCRPSTFGLFAVESALYLPAIQR